MPKKPTILLLITFLLSIHFSFSQNLKFGKVSEEELQEKFYPLDSSANAAILYKKRRTFYDYSDTEGWILTTKMHERIKIYNKEGSKWATKNIRLYKGNDDEKVSIKAYTFNLVKGKVEKIKLKSNEIYSEEINKYWGSKKFTMPNVLDGSILEWEYTIKSPYHHNINDMVFQYNIPLKHIDTKITILEYFQFKYLPSYYYPININQTKKNRNLNFTYRERDDSRVGGPVKTSRHSTTVDLQETVYSSIEENIPALKSEPYINNIENYRSKTSFEYIAYTPKNGEHKYYNTNWETVTKTIYENSLFGEQVKKTSYFSDDLSSLLNKTAPVSEKILTVFQFVKSKIKWDGNYGKYTNKGVRKAYKESTGNVAEINLTLVAMLREAGLKANPILVSTRSHGVPLFPTSDGFNYVIAGVEIQNSIILLDATEPYSFPDVLPMRDLNWKGRLVRNDGSSTSVDLFPKKHAAENTIIQVTLDAEGAIEKGFKRTSYSNILALNYRDKFNAVSNDGRIAKIEEDIDIEITDLKIQHKKNLSKPLTETLRFNAEDFADVTGDKIYISPLLFLTENENPFKLEDRKFPVDFGTPWLEMSRISIQIPDEYVVESLPENIAIGLPEHLGTYKFVISSNGNKVQIVSSTKINSPIIASTYYKELKEFYKQLIDKQSEKIVLSKK